jgi:hypothetical protein
MQLGQILLRKNWISSEHLETVLQLQAQSQVPIRLGELLVQQGFLTSSQLAEALLEQHWRKSGFWVISDRFKLTQT